MGKAERIQGAICSIPWAMTQDYLRLMLEIAQRQNLDPAAVETQTGRKLENTRTVEERYGVAVIPVIGPIARYMNMFSDISGGTSIQVLAKDLREALNNQDIRAILLKIDSPGGEANGVNEFANMVYAARGKKPIVAYVGGIGASAAYWIASAADEIVIDASALIGSIGTVAVMASPDDNEIIFVSSQSPRKHADPKTDTGKDEIQSVLDAMTEVFVGAVARNRGVTTEKVLSDYGQGGLLVGQAAVVAGLADRLGSFEATLAELSNKATQQATAQAEQRLATATVQAGERLKEVVESATAATVQAAKQQARSVAAPPISTYQGWQAATNIQSQIAQSLGISTVVPGRARSNQSKETSRMSDDTQVLDDPMTTAPPEAALTADERAQLFAGERRRMQQEIENIRAEARLEVQREYARLQREQKLTAYAQHIVSPTMERPYALPLEAKEVTVFLLALDGLSPELCTQFQGFTNRILSAKLVDFSEIGSNADGEEARPVAQRWNEAIAAVMRDRNVVKSAAIGIVAEEQPDLYEEYNATTSRVVKKGRR